MYERERVREKERWRKDVPAGDKENGEEKERRVRGTRWAVVSVYIGRLGVPEGGTVRGNERAL